MRVLILGGDGYLGWPTAIALSYNDHQVGIVDSFSKRIWEAEIGAFPLVPILPVHKRVESWNSRSSANNIKMWVCDISTNRHLLYSILDEFSPDAIVHYAEQPSAPYSMLDAHSAVDTQRNNVLGTINLIHAVAHFNPDCHIVKLGTMGEYGTPNIDIEEGWLEVEHNGRKDRVLYPKRPGSWYHLSKVHDSANLEFACRNWGLRVTDLNQGIVYGTGTDETWLSPEFQTSFHYDAVFGTVLNRFIVQAVVEEPLTVYGTGEHVRGFIDIRDTVECVRLALETPAEPGEFRVMNQMTQQYGVNQLAEEVQKALGGGSIAHITNPRVEAARHYYNPKHTKLTSLGLTPHFLDGETIRMMAEVVKKHRKNVDKNLLLPGIQWKQKG